MPAPPASIPIFHITDVSNLPQILAKGGLLSDAIVAQSRPTVIGYGHIKQRRLTQITVSCCGGRFVGEFVPFYYCPRSPMLYTINQGSTGLAVGCQKDIIHLVSTYQFAVGLGRDWAVSDGNAGASYTEFRTGPAALDLLNWTAIHARYWSDQVHAKMAELLVADFFPWSGITEIGCHSEEMVLRVQQLIHAQAHKPQIRAMPTWYY